ncbi:hypothetical protein ACVWXO_005339 [Bradyrhizobium sp. LM2.7]
MRPILAPWLLQSRPLRDAVAEACTHACSYAETSISSEHAEEELDQEYSTAYGGAASFPMALLRGVALPFAWLNGRSEPITNIGKKEVGGITRGWPVGSGLALCVIWQPPRDAACSTEHADFGRAPRDVLGLWMLGVWLLDWPKVIHCDADRSHLGDLTIVGFNAIATRGNSRTEP